MAEAIRRSMSISLFFHAKVEKETYWAKTIPISTGKISTINFNLTENDKQFLWDSGFQAAEKAIKEGLLTEYGRTLQ